jgi:hypothetical protein
MAATWSTVAIRPADAARVDRVVDQQSKLRELRAPDQNLVP